jgi:GH15 family glucan-1,4-alpha-glucosidase
LTETLSPGLIIGDGVKLFFISPNASLKDLSYELDGTGGIFWQSLAVQVFGKIYWLDEKCGKQRYLNNSNIVETIIENEKFSATLLDFVLHGILIRNIKINCESDDVDFYVITVFRPEKHVTQSGSIFDEKLGGIFFYHKREVGLLFFNPPPIITSLTAFRNDPSKTIEEIKQLVISGNIKSSKEYPSIASLAKIKLKRKTLTLFFTSNFTCNLNKTFRAQREVLLKKLQTVTNKSIDELIYERIRSDVRYVSVILKKNSIFNKIKKRSLEIAKRDLLVLRMLFNKKTGLPIAAPEFDEEFTGSNGYGYFWLRDGEKICEAVNNFKDFVNFLVSSYSEKELWGHRYWSSGELVAGWANGHLRSEFWDYQLDQLAYALYGFASYILNSKIITGIEERVFLEACSALLEAADDFGLPRICQNCWENSIGVFSHTTGVFLKAYINCIKALEKIGGDKLAEKFRLKLHLMFKYSDFFWDEKRKAFIQGLSVTPRSEVEKIKDLCKKSSRDLKKTSRLDSGTFELVNGLLDYMDEYGIDKTKVRKIVQHMKTVIPLNSLQNKADGIVRGLLRIDKKDLIEGLIRYEGDNWRKNPTERPEKIWTICTLEGINATLKLISFLDAHNLKVYEKFITKYLKYAQSFFEKFSRNILLCEQIFHDGKEDSARPIGWGHSLRFQIIKNWQKYLVNVS